MLKIRITVKRYDGKKQFKITFKNKFNPRKEKGTKQHHHLINLSFPFLIPGHSMTSRSHQCGISGSEKLDNAVRRSISIVSRGNFYMNLKLNPGTSALAFLLLDSGSSSPFFPLLAPLLQANNTAVRPWT